MYSALKEGPVLHLWHDDSPGEALPLDFQVVIEIPLGSNVKYELDKPSGLLKVDRIITFGDVLPGELWLQSAELHGRRRPSGRSRAVPGTRANAFVD